MDLWRMIETGTVPSKFSSFPCMGKADTFELMQGALPCRYASRHPLPGSDLAYPPTSAIMCFDCERMQGFAGTHAAAVKIWNAWSRTAPGRHIWAGTDGDAEEVCVMCAAASAIPAAAALCLDSLASFLIREDRH